MIKKVIIHNYRNLENKELQFKRINLIQGQNKLGKTNVLNAICWAITGADLSNSISSLDAVPHGKDSASVYVEFDNGNIERTILKAGINFKTIIKVNGIIYETAKDGEQAIDDLLGFDTKLGNKDFVIRRFFINPLYFSQAKGLREFLIKMVEEQTDAETVFKGLNKGIQQLLGDDLINCSYSVETLSKSLKKQIDETKERIDKWDFVAQYLLAHDLEDKEVSNIIKTLQNDLAGYLEKKTALDLYVEQLSLAYDKAIGSKFKFIETTATGTYKNCCKAILPSGIEFDNGSTSEQILFALNFVNDFDNGTHLFDLAECFDTDNFKNIVSCDAQIIVAKVGDEQCLTLKYGD